MKKSLIVLPELSLGINPDLIKCMKQIALLLLINIEHYTLFENGAILTPASRY